MNHANTTYRTINEKEVKELLSDPNGVPCVLVFSSDVLVNAQIMDGFYQFYSEKYAGKIAFFRIDAEMCRHIVIQFRIKHIPTTFILKQSKIVDRISGAIPRSSIDKYLTRLISKK